MKKVLMMMMSLLLVSPISAASGDREDLEMPVKPKAQKQGIHFKIRRDILKGPKAKNRRAWKDQAPIRPMETRTVRRKTKGPKRRRTLST